MSRVVEPTQGPNRQAFPTRLAVANRYGGGDWIVPQDQDIQATRDPILSAGPLNSFQYQAGQTNGRNITFGTGEAFVGGCYVASDNGGHVSHDVTLDASTVGQSVYLGFEYNEKDELKIGLASDFDSQDPTVEIYQFDTDATTVTNWVDMRPYGAEDAIVDIGSNLSQLDARYVNGNDADVGFLAQDETVAGQWTFTSDILMHQPGATLELGGDSGGPHAIEFGNDAGEDRLQWIYRTSPDELRLETTGGMQYMGLPLAADSPFDFKNQQVANFLFEKRTNNPGSASAWRPWVRTDLNNPAGTLVVETADGPYQIEMSKLADPSGNLVVDGYEDGDMTEYNIPSSSGTASPVTIKSMTGNRSLELDGTVQPMSHGSFSPKLPYYPRRGDKWEFWVQFTGMDAGSSFRFYYGKQSTLELKNAYELHMYSDGTFRVQLDVNQTNTHIAGTNIGSFSLNTWYRVRVWWGHPEQAGGHTIELYDNSTSSVVATISGEEETYSGGGFLLWNGAGSTTYVDDIQILDRT